MQNTDTMSFQEFMNYCIQNKVTISPADAKGFQEWVDSKNYQMEKAPLKAFKSFYFNVYQNDPNVYFYYDNKFVDYGPLPQLDPFPPGIPMQGNVPLNKKKK